MEIETLVLGPVLTNTYILKNGKKALVIDPSFHPEIIMEHLKGYELEAFLLTHGHYDHIAALEGLQAYYPQAPVYIHRIEEKYIRDAVYNLSNMLGNFYEYKGDLNFVEDSQTLHFLGLDIDIIFTPGHTEGSICYYIKSHDLAFTGDTLFKDSIGRSDFPGGNLEVMLSSIKNILYKLPQKTVIYPGHKEITTIGDEIEKNPFTKEENS